MFLSSSSLSFLINKDSLKFNLNPLFSGMRIEKSSDVALWPCNKVWFVGPY